MASIDPRLPARTMPVAERMLWAALPVGGLCVLLFALLTGTTLPWEWHLPWVPALNLGIDVRIDGLSALMLLLILGVGSAVFVYAGGYLAGHPQQRRAYFLLTLFATAMAGCVSADNLLLLFLFWESTSLLSFLLVGFNHHDESSRKSAQQAMLVTGAGGLAMLGGFVILGQMTDTWRVSNIIAQLPTLPDNAALRAAIALIMTGAFAKSAQFPFHFWLPNAMSAPTPVSAYLHSATMVKLGVYLLARLDAGMDAYAWWQGSLQFFGLFTAAWGMLLVLRERDLKRILAWSTVATLGLLIFAVGMPGPEAAAAVAAFLLAHAMYKATLFFVAGNVDHGTGTRLIDCLGLLRKAMPLTAAAALLGGLSMAGMPGTFGFMAKSVLHAAEHHAPHTAFASPANLIFSVIGAAVAATIALRIFWQARQTQEPPAHPHEGGLALTLPPLALASLGVLLGLFPGVVQGLVQQAAGAMHPAIHSGVAGTAPVTLALNGQVLVSELSALLMNWGGALAVFLLWERLYACMDGILKHLPSGAGTFQKALQLLSFSAVNTSRRMQHGKLSGYHAMLIGVFTLCLLAVMVASGSWQLPAWTTPSAGVVLACAIMVTGAVLSILVHSRLLLALVSGLVAYGCSVLFLFTGAPDLAFTQFMTETILVVVVAAVLLLLRLDKTTDYSPLVVAPKWSRILIAALAATTLTGLLLAVSAQPFDDLLSAYFGGHSLLDAHGRNVVNVILVDFRGFDTLGEVSVVCLTLLSALPLVAAIRRRMSTRIDTAAAEVPDNDNAGDTP